MNRSIFLLVVVSGLHSSLNAAVVDFTVDPSLTRWRMRGAYYREGQQEGDFVPQSAGSDTTSLVGILRVDLTADTIQFLPGSSLRAVLQPTPQAPGLNGASGVDPADFGVTTSTLPLPTPVIAVRDFAFTLSSPPIALVGNHFTEDLEAVVDATIDYDLGTATGSYVLDNWQRGFDDDHGGSPTTSGLVQTLTLQNYLGDIFALQRPSDSYIEWAGPIVATRVIPEPNALVLAATCAVAVLGLMRPVGRRSKADRGISTGALA